MRSSGESSAASSGSMSRDGHAEGVLQRDRGLEGDHVLGSAQREQVARAVQVDLLPGPAEEVREQPEGALPEPDVELVGELRADATGGLRRRAGTERPAVEQQHVGDAGLGEVEGRADAHDAPTDDDDARGGGQVAHASRKPGSYGSSRVSICAFCSRR